MATVNKFNIDWQLVRVDARAIKDVRSKINHVVSFLNKNKSKENYGRVMNWLKMTKVAYKDPKQRALFDAAIAKVDKGSYTARDNDNDLSKMSTDKLQKVYKDLSKRKYGFQFKSTPKAHTDFVNAIKAELDKR